MELPESISVDSYLKFLDGAARRLNTPLFGLDVACVPASRMLPPTRWSSLRAGISGAFSNRSVVSNRCPTTCSDQRSSRSTEWRIFERTHPGSVDREDASSCTPPPRRSAPRRNG